MVGWVARNIAADFVHRLPLGTAVKLTLDDGKKVKGTLIGTEPDAVVLRLRTRVPEPPQTVVLTRIVDADIEHPSHTGKAIAIGAAVGTGATFGTLMLLAALLSE